MNYVRKRKLFRYALNLFQSSEKEFKSVSCMFGTYLEEDMKFFDSGMAYICGNDHQGALRSFKKASSWKEVFISAHNLGMRPEALEDLALEIAGIY